MEESIRSKICHMSVQYIIHTSIPLQNPKNDQRVLRVISNVRLITGKINFIFLF